jgi:hypothetical protein
MTHEQLQAEVMTALDKLFADTSVSKEVTAASLREIKALIDEMIESL